MVSHAELVWKFVLSRAVGQHWGEGFSSPLSSPINKHYTFLQPELSLKTTQSSTQPLSVLFFREQFKSEQTLGAQEGGGELRCPLLSATLSSCYFVCEGRWQTYIMGQLHKHQQPSSMKKGFLQPPLHPDRLLPTHPWATSHTQPLGQSCWGKARAFSAFTFVSVPRTGAEGKDHREQTARKERVHQLIPCLY